MLRVAEQAYRSDTGRQRTANEDALFARAPLFAVADGMGGAQAGEVASRIAAESFEPAERRDESPEVFLRSIAERANERIHSLAQHDSSRSGMGTTLTAALVEDDEVSLAHVGDSRAYLYREGELKMLTSDHSLVEELRRQGRLTDEQAEDHPQRSIITRALGPEAEVEVDTLTVSARPGDVFLICSDGLTTMVKDQRIAEVLAETPNLDDAVTTLIREANDAGGRDNVTVVAFRLAEAEDLAADEGATLVGPSAEEAGLTAGAVREAAARDRARRGTPVAASRPSRWRTAAKVLVAAAIVAAVCVGAWLGARQIYFLGTDEGGRLALYRGLPYELPLGIDLYSEEYSLPVQVASLPEERRDEATDHDLRSRDDAVDLLDDLERDAIAEEPTVAPSGGDAGAAGGGDAGAAGGGAGQDDGAQQAGDGGQQAGGQGAGDRTTRDRDRAGN
ncbi:MAG TPA: Stp1/IreP family PP2C-type Ser/Thr phosphatase [Solirubrobacterales bacterium]|nr:Stp1/IreP family PP2C-type Ser/Thr phosphatase [Solirubrobacterales bacterium]